MKGGFNGWFDLNTGEIDVHLSYSCNSSNNEEELMKELKKDFRKWWKKFAKKNEIEDQGKNKNCHFKRCEIYVKKRKKILTDNQKGGYNE
jgi:hypothetical protein